MTKAGEMAGMEEFAPMTPGKLKPEGRGLGGCRDAPRGGRGLILVGPADLRSAQVPENGAPQNVADCQQRSKRGVRHDETSGLKRKRQAKGMTALKDCQEPKNRKTLFSFRKLLLRCRICWVAGPEAGAINYGKNYSFVG